MLLQAVREDQDLARGRAFGFQHPALVKLVDASDRHTRHLRGLPDGQLGPWFDGNDLVAAIAQRHDIPKNDIGRGDGWAGVASGMNVKNTASFR